MTFPHSATIQRLVAEGSKSTFTELGTSECFLQPLSSEYSNIYGITFGKGFSCFMPYSTDVAEGDRVVIDSNGYGVQGVRDHNYGNLAHKRLFLELV